MVFSRCTCDDSEWGDIGDSEDREMVVSDG